MSFSKNWFLVPSLACAFFSAGLVFRFYLVSLNERRHADYESNLVLLNEEMARNHGLSSDVLAVSQNQYSGFEHVSMVMTDLQTISAHVGLVVLDATSRPMDTKEKTLFGQVPISTRMKGNYKDIKNVISKLLATHEGLSLDGLSFRRARAADPLLDAEVRMTFYYKKDA